MVGEGGGGEVVRKREGGWLWREGWLEREKEGVGERVVREREGGWLRRGWLEREREGG